MLYRWLLRLYPYQFRHQYQDELEADFLACREDASRSGRRVAVLRCYVEAAADVVVSAPREWLRTPWIPVLTVAALVATLVFYSVVVRVYRAGSFAGGSQRPESPELLLLMAVMVLIPIAAMALIAIASRFGSVKPHARRRRV